ncbi:hypothetical protein AVEN_93821-1 [Araneus ventricosus]|uniref:Uncharacterized protein n=1 Tax=Araneus ventricosus TaxID=182803 RepID=A0A4Y2AXJ4_ARAVE|nr:hypothetical protein AVEN_93821-1 [Araneus ventricosus]
MLADIPALSYVSIRRSPMGSSQSCICSVEFVHQKFPHSSVKSVTLTVGSTKSYDICRKEQERLNIVSECQIALLSSKNKFSSVRVWPEMCLLFAEEMGALASHMLGFHDMLTNQRKRQQRITTARRRFN